MMNYYTLTLAVSCLLGIQTSATSLGQYRQQLVNQLTTTSSDFSQRLYQKISVDKDNIVYSPYSIHSAFSMASEGAKGRTLTEMRNVLGLSALGYITHIVYRSLNQQLSSTNDVRLIASNALFINSAYDVKTTLIDAVNNNYLAPVKKLNFQARGGAEKEVNDFVAMKTEGLVKDILPPNSLNAYTVVVLVNTLFFNGTWKEQFSPWSTRKRDFYQLGGSKKQVDTMQGIQNLKYKNDANRKVHVLEMPFKGNRFSLYIVLPHEVDGITSLEKSLTNGVEDFFQNLRTRSLDLKIPTFKVETKLSLKQPLIDMGMTQAFLPHADFSGITNQGVVYIDDAIHQAFLEVKETGTVAAAATAVSGQDYSMALNMHDDQVDLNINHPFLFFLRDSQTGQILFQGKFSG